MRFQTSDMNTIYHDINHTVAQAVAPDRVKGMYLEFLKRTEFSSFNAVLVPRCTTGKFNVLDASA